MALDTVVKLPEQTNCLLCAVPTQTCIWIQEEVVADVRRARGVVVKDGEVTDAREDEIL